MLDFLIMNNSDYKNIRGFTLVEMSIVLVIIGLIVGGILTGRELVEAAKIRKVIAEVDNITMGIATFRDKFDEIPGDMPNATSYWPGVTSDGNGDGILYVPSDDPRDTEGGYLWHHLSLAKLYRYFPRPASGNWTLEYGVNTPEIIEGTSAVGSFEKRYHTANLINVGVPSPGARNIRCGDAIDHMMAYAIDRKSDDGSPSSGRVVAFTQTSPCSTSPSRSTCTSFSGQYDYQENVGTVDFDLDKEDSKCRMAFFVFTD